MSPRLMSEPEAWREIARRIAEGTWQEDGLCEEIYYLCLKRQITADAEEAAVNRVRRHLAGGVYDPDFDACLGMRSAYLCAPGDAGPRILAALFLALEAEDESRRVSPPGGAR